MSFAQETRNELIRHYTKNLHCQKAEFAAVMLFDGFVDADGRYVLPIVDEELARKYEAAYKKNFDIHPVVEETSDNRKPVQLVTTEPENLKTFEKFFLQGKEPDAVNIREIPFLLSSVVKKQCCTRAFLRGAFIAAGTVSDPEKQYHFEIVCEHELIAAFIQNLINGFDISAKVSKRRGRYVVYIKEAIEIVDMLNVIEAHVSLMNFENARIIHEMRGNVNRKVNCETANIEKTIAASMKQIEDINYIKEHLGFAHLDETLVQIAQARMEHPDVPLSKLGDKLNPPIGKSGVNHRFRKIKQIADELRKENQE